jgi:hypothetical protein
MRILLLKNVPELDRAARTRIERQLRAFLRPFAGRLGRVTARIHSSGAGVAACSIEARLRPSGRLFIYGTGPDFLDAAERAAASLASAVESQDMVSLLTTRA